VFTLDEYKEAEARAADQLDESVASFVKQAADAQLNAILEKLSIGTTH
jgi:hypothetical protein